MLISILSLSERAALKALMVDWTMPDLKPTKES